MRYTEQQQWEMVRLYGSGHRLREIAELMGVPLPTVYWYLKKHGVKLRSSGSYKKVVSVETRRKISEAQTGKKRPLEFRRKMSEAAKRRGANHNWYVDGKGAERDTARRREMDRFRYKLWRESVFERDAFTCQICKRRGSIVLRADHIKSWKNNPELRYSVDNGRTLCDACHRQTPTYGAKLIAESEL